MSSPNNRTSKPTLGEFAGFDKFWRYARKVWSLYAALRIYHECRDAYVLLDRALKLKYKE